MATSQIAASAGTLARNSVAYLESEDRITLDEYAVNTRRISQVLSLKPSCGVIRNTDDLVGGGTVANLQPDCVVGAYMYGHAGKVLYRSLDGDNWAVVNTWSDEEEIGGVYSIQGDNYPLVVTHHRVAKTDPVVDVYRGKVWYWSGSAWVQATYQIPDGEGGWDAWEDGITRMRYSWSYGLTQAPHGTIIAAYFSVAPSAEAAAAGHHAHDAWRSTDSGRTWRRCLRFDYAATSGESYLWPIVSHNHAIGYHAGTARWVIDTGDGSNTDPRTGAAANRMLCLISDDDGLTWKDWNTGKVAGSEVGWSTPSPLNQQVHYHDYGHPTRLAFASDSAQRVAAMDMVDFSAYPIIDPVPQPLSSPEQQPYFVWVTQHNGWWLAGSAGSSATPTNSISDIWCSLDGELWTTLHQFQAGEQVDKVSYFAGQIGGKLHFGLHIANTAYKHFVCNPPSGRILDGVVVSPGRTNLYSSDVSQGQTTTGFSGIYDTVVATVTTPKMRGTHAIKISRTAASAGVKFPDVDPTIGVVYQSSCWVRRASGSAMAYAQLRFPWYSLTGQHLSSVPDDRWIRLVTRPRAAASTNDQAGVFVLANLSGADSELFIDGLELAVAGTLGPWQVGGTAQVAEVLTRNVTLSSDWTYTFAMRSFGSREDLAATTEYEIMRWHEDKDDYVRLFFDTTDNKFKVAVKTAGDEDETVAETAAKWWHRGATWRFVVRHTDGRVRASLLGPQATEHFTAAVDKGGNAMSGARTTVSGSAVPVFPCVIADEQWSDVAISDANLEAGDYSEEEEVGIGEGGVHFAGYDR
jgi:hypothetical protein